MSGRSCNPSRLSLLTSLLALLVLVPAVVTAQGFFEQFFGGGAHQHHQQPQPGPAERWRNFGASIECIGYLCPNTFDCVHQPVDCPCPNEQDVKCILDDDGAYACTRGDSECSALKKASKAI